MGELAALLAPLALASVLRRPADRVRRGSPPTQQSAIWRSAGQPGAMSRRDKRDRQREILATLPEAVVLVKLVLGAGLAIPGALRSVGDVLPGVVGESFKRCMHHVDLGWRLDDAVDHLRVELSPHGDAFVSLLHSGLHDGGTMRPSFEVLMHELRSARRREAEISARRVPVLLLFPLVMCVLPAFVLLAIVPLLAGALTGVAGP